MSRFKLKSPKIFWGGGGCALSQAPLTVDTPSPHPTARLDRTPLRNVWLRATETRVSKTRVYSLALNDRDLCRVIHVYNMLSLLTEGYCIQFVFSKSPLTHLFSHAAICVPCYESS